jgi:hypothetical protein
LYFYAYNIGPVVYHRRCSKVSGLCDNGGSA